MASKKADTGILWTTSAAGQQSQQRPGHGQEMIHPGPPFQSLALGQQQSGFRSPEVVAKPGQRATTAEGQSGQKDEDAVASLDLYIESLEADAREEGVYVPPSPWHSATDNSVDMYYGLEEMSLFPTTTASTTPPSASTAVSSAVCLPPDISGKTAGRGSLTSGEHQTSLPSSAMPTSAGASRLALESHSYSTAESCPTKVQQSGRRPLHGRDQSSSKTQQAEGRVSREGSREERSGEYQKLLEKYRTLRRNMVSLCVTAQREMQSKLHTIAQLRGALENRDSQSPAGGGVMLQPDGGQDQNPGSAALHRGVLSQPSSSGRQRPECAKVHQSWSCVSAASHSQRSATKTDGVIPSASDHVSAKSTVHSSSSTHTGVPEKQVQAESLTCSNKRVQTDSKKSVRRHTQTDSPSPVHKLIQTNTLVTSDALMQTDLLRLVDKPVQTDLMSSMDVEKTHSVRLVSKSVETDSLVDVVVGMPVLRDSLRPGSTNEAECLDSEMDMAMEQSLETDSSRGEVFEADSVSMPVSGDFPGAGSSGDADFLNTSVKGKTPSVDELIVDNPSPTVLRESPYNRSELKDRGEIIQSEDDRSALSYMDQVAQREGLHHTQPRAGKRQLEPSSGSEFGESKRARRRLSSDEYPTQYLSDSNPELSPRNASHGSSQSVEMTNHSDHFGPAYSEGVNTKTAAALHHGNPDTASSIAADALLAGSVSGAVVGEQEKVFGHNTKQKTPTRAAQGPAYHSKMHCPTRSSVDAAPPPQAGKGARAVHSSTQPPHGHKVWGPYKDVKDEAWKRQLLLWPCYAHRRGSRRKEIDAVFFGEESAKEYDWSGVGRDGMELVQEPSEQDETQTFAQSYDLQPDWTQSHTMTTHEMIVEKLEEDSLQQQHTVAAEEGHNVDLEASSPKIGKTESDNPNPTSSVSTSSATGSVHKQKKKKKKKDRKKDKHSADKRDEKREKKRKKRKNKDDPSMNDPEGASEQKESEIDPKQSDGNYTPSKLKTVDEVDQSYLVNDADGVTVVNEMFQEAEGNVCHTDIQTNELSSAEVVEDDIDTEMTSHPQITSEVLDNPVDIHSCATDHNKNALCQSPKERELVDQTMVESSQEGREIGGGISVNTCQKDGEINTNQANSEATNKSEMHTNTGDNAGEGDSDISIHTDDSDSEEWSVKTSSQSVVHQPLTTLQPSETARLCAYGSVSSSESKADVTFDEVAVSRDEDGTVDETARNRDLKKDDSIEVDADANVEVCADDLMGPTEDENISITSNDSTNVNEDEMLNDRAWHQKRTLESSSKNKLENGTELRLSPMAAAGTVEDEAAQDWPQTVSAYRHTSIGSGPDIVEHTRQTSTDHSSEVCEYSSHQQQDDAGYASVAEPADRTWSQIQSTEAGSSDSVKDGTRTASAPLHDKVISEGGSLLITRKEVEAEEENAVDATLSEINTTPVCGPQQVVTPKKNWLLRTKLTADGEESTLFGQAIRTAAIRDLSDPSFIWSPEKTSSNTLSLRKPISKDSFYNMLGLPSNSRTSSEESLARSIHFVDSSSESVVAGSHQSQNGKSLFTSSEGHKEDVECPVGSLPLQQAQDGAVQVLAKPCQPPQQTSDRQNVGDQSHRERQLDMGPEEGVPVEVASEDKTPLFGYPSATHSFPYKRRPLHLPPSSSSSASSVTASRSSSLTSASLSSLSTERLAPSQQISDRASQNQRTAQDRVGQDRGGVEDEHVRRSELSSTGFVPGPRDALPSGKGVQLLCPQDPEMSQREGEQLSQRDSSEGKSHAEGIIERSGQGSGQLHVNILKDTDSLTPSAAELGTSTCAARPQRREFEEGEIDSRDSVYKTPSYTAVGNTSGSFTRLTDITEQSLEEGEIPSSDELDAGNDQHLPCDDGVLSVASGYDIDDDANFRDLREMQTGKRQRSPDTSKRMTPSSKKQKTRTEKAESRTGSHDQTLAPEDAVPKSKGCEDRKKAAGQEEADAGHGDDKENGQVDKRAQQRRQRNRDRLEEVRRQIVGHEQPHKEHAQLKSFTIPKVKRSSGRAQVQKDQTLASENTKKTSVRRKEGEDSSQRSKYRRVTETRQEKYGRDRRLPLEKDSRDRRRSTEKDGKDRKRSMGKDSRDGKHSVEKDTRDKRRSTDTDFRDRRQTKERDSRRRSEETDVRHRRRSEERDGRHRQHSDERDDKHRQHSDERDSRHRQHSEERDSRHRQRSKERDRHRQRSEERGSRHRRRSEERDVGHRRHSEERNRDRRYGSKRDDRDRRPNRRGDSRERRRSKDRDRGGRGPSKEEGAARDRRNNREQSGKNKSHSKERDDKDARSYKPAGEKDTKHGKQGDDKQANFRQEREHRSAIRKSTDSADTMTSADGFVSRPPISAGSGSGAQGRRDHSESPSPSVTNEPESPPPQSAGNRPGPRQSADCHRLPTNSADVLQIPSESSVGSRQLPGESPVKDKQSSNESCVNERQPGESSTKEKQPHDESSVRDEQSPKERSSESRLPPQEELIPPESHDLVANVTQTRNSEDMQENTEHLSESSQSEVEIDSDCSFSVSDSDSESSDSLTDLDFEGSMRTRGFIYFRDPVKPRPELEMSFEDEEDDSEEEENGEREEEEETGHKSEDSEPEDEEDSGDEVESGEEDMSEDAEDDDNDDDEGQSKPNEADDTDTDDDEGGNGRPEGCGGKSSEHQDPGHADDEDSFSHESDSKMADNCDNPQPTADSMVLCAGTSNPIEKTHAFVGPDHRLTAEKPGHVGINSGQVKPARSAERRSSREGSVGQRLGHPEGKCHHHLPPEASPCQQIYGQVLSDCLSLDPPDDAESFLLGES